MTTRLLLAFLLALVAAPVFAQQQMPLRDEGTIQGQANEFNCTGAGISCSVTGGVGTINVPGGAAAESIGPTELNETANYEFTGTTYDAVTLAGLPAPGTARRLIWVTDCESTTSCSAGDGSEMILHFDDGTAWVPIFTGTAVPTLTTVMGAGNKYYNADCTLDQAFIVGDSDSDHWKICYDATEGLRIIQVVGGVADAGNRTTWCRDTYNVQVKSRTDGTTLLNIDCDAKTMTGLAVKKSVEVVPVDFATATSTGLGKFYFRVPTTLDGYTVTGIQANVIAAGTTGTLNVDIEKCAAAGTGNVCSSTTVDLLSTNLTIDSGENSSTTAAAPAVISAVAGVAIVAAGDILRFDIDAIHTTAAQGLIVVLDFTGPQ